MTMTAEAVLRAVSKTLFEQVLPELRPATWVASNVRACAMLLVYLEDRVIMERSLLRTTNARMREFLGHVASEGVPSAQRATLTDEVNAVLNQFATLADDEADAEALREENDAYKRALENIVLATADERNSGAAGERFSSELRACLAFIEAAEQPMTSRANQYVPM